VVVDDPLLVTDALKKKGLRLPAARLLRRNGQLVTDALKKKGLRPPLGGGQAVAVAGDRCPEEEGIKTD